MTSKWAAALLTLTIAYFAYHALAGEQGLGRWSDIQQELADKQATLDQLMAENAALQKDIARLTPGRVDADLIEVLAREELGFLAPGELVVLESDRTYANMGN